MKSLIEQIKKQIKKLLGIKSPSLETIRQWELWQTLSPEEREKIADKERQYEIEHFGKELDWSFWWEDMIDDDN